MWCLHYRSRIVKTILACCALVFLTACGDKVPESKAAKELGNVPKQTLDKATMGVDQALTKGADKLKDADEKK